MATQGMIRYTCFQCTKWMMFDKMSTYVVCSRCKAEHHFVVTLDVAGNVHRRLTLVENVENPR